MCVEKGKVLALQPYLLCSQVSFPLVSISITRRRPRCSQNIKPWQRQKEKHFCLSVCYNKYQILLFVRKLCGSKKKIFPFHDDQILWRGVKFTVQAAPSISVAIHGTFECVECEGDSHKRAERRLATCVRGYRSKVTYSHLTSAAQVVK